MDFVGVFLLMMDFVNDSLTHFSMLYGRSECSMVNLVCGKNTDSNLHLQKHDTQPGPGCSKLTTSLVNVTLKFQTLISQICQYCLLKKCEKLLHCKSFSHFFNKKYQCFWL